MRLPVRSLGRWRRKTRYGRPQSFKTSPCISEALTGICMPCEPKAERRSGSRCLVAESIPRRMSLRDESMLVAATGTSMAWTLRRAKFCGRRRPATESIAHPPSTTTLFLLARRILFSMLSMPAAERFSGDTRQNWALLQRLQYPGTSFFLDARPEACTPWTFEPEK